MTCLLSKRSSSRDRRGAQDGTTGRVPFNGKLLDELLQRETFLTVTEARHLAGAFRFEYNHCRPHSSLGYKTAAEFADGTKERGHVKRHLRSRGLPQHSIRVIVLVRVTPPCHRAAHSTDRDRATVYHQVNQHPSGRLQR
jgi:hypothetical protein